MRALRPGHESARGGRRWLRQIPTLDPYSQRGVEMGAAGRSIKRAPFAATVARPDRRAAGRTWAPRTPLAVRTSGLTVDPDLRRRIHRRLGWRLGKFAPRIE